MNADVRRLVRKLDSADMNDAIQAADQLAAMGAREAAGPLIDLLERSLGNYAKRSLVSCLIEALGRLEATEAEPVLLRALASKLYFIKGAAAEALGKVASSRQAVDGIKNVIEEDPPAEVKKEAVKGLGSSGRPRAVEHLVDVIRTEHDQEVRQEAVEAIGEAAAHPQELMEYYYRVEANGKLKADLIVALSRIGAAGSIDTLLAALEDTSPEVRSCAALALGEVGDPRAVPALRLLLDDPREHVRKNAAKALGLIEFLPRVPGP